MIALILLATSRINKSQVLVDSHNSIYRWIAGKFDNKLKIELIGEPN